MQTQPSQRYARRSTGGRQQQTFGQELAHQPAASRAQRCANRHFSRPRCTARHHQSSHVDARDQKDKTHRAEQHLRHEPIVAQISFAQWHRHRRRDLVDVSRGDQAFVHARQVCPGLLIGIGPKRDPKVGLVGVNRFTRQHADHRIRRVIQLQNLTEDIGAATELALPQAVADQRHFTAVLDILFREEIAAEHRLQAQHAREVEGHARALDACRFAESRQVEVPASKHGHAFKGAALRAPGVKVRIGDRDQLKIPPRRRFIQIQEALGLAKRQRAEEQAVEDAENCGSGGHAQREHRHYREAEPGVARQRTHGRLNREHSLFLRRFRLFPG